MRREIQVHFENSGQILWHEEIEDVHTWLASVMADEKVIAYDQESGRHFGFVTKTVTAFIISNKTADSETDLWRRNYAACQGNVKENSVQEHSRDGIGGISSETGRSSCY